MSNVFESLLACFGKQKSTVRTASQSMGNRGKPQQGMINERRDEPRFSHEKEETNSSNSHCSGQSNRQRTADKIVMTETTDTALIMIGPLGFFQKEAKVWQAIHFPKRETGFPLIFDHSSDLKQSRIVFEKLGDSVHDKIKALNRVPVPLKTVFLLGIQLLSRLETIHSKGYIHGNLNVDNIVVGRPNSDEENVIYLTNLENVRIFRDSNGNHIKEKDRDKEHFCNILYAPISYHKGMELCRRDDIESLVYFLLLLLLLKKLPWYFYSSVEYTMKDVIMESKEGVGDLALFEKVPELLAVLKLARNTKFEDTPDYKLMRKYFRTALNRHCPGADDKLEWTVQSPSFFSLEN